MIFQSKQVMSAVEYLLRGMFDSGLVSRVTDAIVVNGQPPGQIQVCFEQGGFLVKAGGTFDFTVFDSSDVTIAVRICEVVGRIARAARSCVVFLRPASKKSV